MIRIAFHDGSIVDCDHIDRIYVEEFEMDKVFVVGRIGDENWSNDKRDEAVSNEDVSGQAEMAREGSEDEACTSNSDLQEIHS